MNFDELDMKNIIRPYFNALYKGVDEFHSHIRAETESLRKKNSELEERVTVMPPGAERNKLFKAIAGNLKAMENNAGNLDSPLMEKEALEYAARKVRRDDPDLCEEFDHVSASLKCDYLLKEFEKGFRSALQDRLISLKHEYIRKTSHAASISEKESTFLDEFISELEWEECRDALETEAAFAKEVYQKFETYMGSSELVDADANFAAERRLRDVFPELAEQRDAEWKLHFEEKLGRDPEGLYTEIMKDYAFRYLGALGEQLVAAERDLEKARREIEKHNMSLPSHLQNVMSVGTAQKVWMERHGELLNNVDKIVDAVAKTGALREEARDFCVSDVVREWVEKQIALRHPELIDACAGKEREQWEKANNDRLESQKERQNERGKTEGLSHGQGVIR